MTAAERDATDVVPGGQELGGCGQEAHQEDLLSVCLCTGVHLPRQARRKFAVDQLFSFWSLSFCDVILMS
ncbi:hypothetical protein LXH13_39460 [Streptomyces spinosirectus]|uniref:hypothetical protein n=1 Tax=Streptomyces TaxID=1883 RepID=UPI0013E8D935|nr:MULTISPECIES: hypothetical protein [Streptomyces]MBY8345334.1 hypothetical protein [Streptomyces plumbidurans]UIR22741.1 hypothetical protein LXH13_39460 [Streptomyces spinosirectus]